MVPMADYKGKVEEDEVKGRQTLWHAQQETVNASLLAFSEAALGGGVHGVLRVRRASSFENSIGYFHRDTVYRIISQTAVIFDYMLVIEMFTTQRHCIKCDSPGLTAHVSKKSVDATAIWRSIPYQCMYPFGQISRHGPPHYLLHDRANTSRTTHTLSKPSQ